MLKQVKLNVVEEFNYYNQVPQVSSLQYSFLNRVKGEKDTFQELHLSAKCREYMGDVVVCGHLDINVPVVYGFKLEEKRMSLKETLLSVSLGSKEMIAFKKNIKFLRKIEKAMGISLTRHYPTQLSNKIVLVGDKKWTSSPLLISLYSQIIRSLTYFYKAKTFDDHIKALITGPYCYGSDANGFKVFRDSGSNIHHLLLNIDKVLGDNPLTGINDEALKVRKQNIITNSSAIHLYSKSDNRDVTWYLQNNHSGSGYISFLSNLAILRSAYNSDFLNVYIGYKWVKNYASLLKSEEEGAE